MIGAPSRLLVLAACAALAACANTNGPGAASNAYADFLVGRVANAREDHAAAADRYFAALARRPGDEVALQGALSASLALGDIARARRAASLAPQRGAPAQAHILRAAEALNAGAFARAERESDRAEGATADELVARMLGVWARVGEGRVDDVLVQLEPLASIRPYGGLFAYQQAMALDYAGRAEEALRAYQIAAGGGLWLPSGAERHADLLARAGARESAVALLADPDVVRGSPALASALERARAGAAVARARLTPARGAAVGLYGLGAIFFQEHDNDSGLMALSLAMMLDPDLHEARISIAEAHARLRNFGHAERMLAGVPARSDYAASARVLEAWLLYDQDRSGEALALAQAVAETGDLRAERALADMYRRQNRYEEAEAVYSRMIEAGGEDWRLLFARAAARHMMERWPEAEADLLRALELSPDQPDVMNYLGYTWVDRGERLSEGLAMLQRAVEMRPQSAAIIDSVGWAYYRLGDYTQALTYLERAVQLSPMDATLNDHLGDVYWRLGRRIEARFQWRRALGEARADDVPAIEAKIENGLAPLPETLSATR